MRTTAYTLEREHAYAKWSKAHTHFAKTAHRMPAYTLEATPFRWVMREQAQAIADTWGITYDGSLEEQADGRIGFDKPSTWVQDHRNQLALLDSFFSALVPGRSLVLLYAKDVPLIEERAPGARILIGAGTITTVGASVEWEYSARGPLRSIMWERAVGHSIRPNFEDGFLLPYQALLGQQPVQGLDLSPFIASAPPDHFEEFSYVSEHAGHDAAIAALLELARVVDLLPGVIDGPWEKVAAWISSRIADAWILRGPYPGLGAALTAVGLERGAVVAHRVVEQIGDKPDLWSEVGKAIADGALGRGPCAGLIGRMGRKAWEALSADKERFALLRALARFSLTADQARRMFDRAARAADGISATDADLLANPYLIYELDRGRRDPIGLLTVDRGLFPRDAGAAAALLVDPLPDPVTEAADDRRTRAGCADVLERAALQGHTLLDEPRLRRELSRLECDPRCDPTDDLFQLAAQTFGPVLVETLLARSGRGWQLDRLAKAKAVITADVSTRLKAGPLRVDWNWRAAIDTAIGGLATPDDSDEESARTEKASALRILARSRLGVLIGPAGTGKTTMLRALCAEPGVKRGGVLLLAPTGKARVQLADRVGSKAFTLAQFLRPLGRWNDEFGYKVTGDVKREGAYDTVIVDEASMLTEEMLAALLDATTGIERLVLCGDHRQLPPIGAGRPFADLIKYLSERDTETKNSAESQSKEGCGIAELTVNRRFTRMGLAEPRSVVRRDDLAVASLFSIDGAPAGSDEAFARVLDSKGDGTITVVSWTDEDDLYEKIVRFLADDPELRLTPGDADALKRSLGAAGTYNGRASFEFGAGSEGAENWQILTPVRSRPGGVVGLNRLIRRTWRRGDATVARRSYQLPPPLGADEILFHDKVMCVANHERKAWDPTGRKSLDGDVANGEIGMAVGWAKQKGIRVEFSTQPGIQFTFWTSEMNADRERVSELLELAYAVTVHKAQGSQFRLTLVVVPNPCGLLSPEMLYTALTRQRERTVVFVQGPPQGLREFASPWKSETARRLTCLFRPSDPFESEGQILDGAHVHRTANGEMVQSKGEVIVANTLRGLAISYRYEAALHFTGEWPRWPDFTIKRPGASPVYWEHLGMLDRAGYRADWEAKQGWYAAHGILPWSAGGGPSGVLVWSIDDPITRGIDSQAIEKLAKDVFAVST
jgi:ATP-dependent exoDNAse (exonuclease V) alpha subunit